MLQHSGQPIQVTAEPCLILLPDSKEVLDLLAQIRQRVHDRLYELPRPTKQAVAFMGEHDSPCSATRVDRILEDEWIAKRAILLEMGERNLPVIRTVLRFGLWSFKQRQVK